MDGSFKEELGLSASSCMATDGLVRVGTSYDRSGALCSTPDEADSRKILLSEAPKAAA